MTNGQIIEQIAFKRQKNSFTISLSIQSKQAIMENLKLAIVQASLIWQDPKANRDRFEKVISSVHQQDLILLPEMFTTGFSMNSRMLAEPMTGETMKWMTDMAKQSQAVICGTFIVKERDDYYNRLVWMQPDGQHLWYDKRHLFRMAKEHENYTAGLARKIMPLKGWRICPLICYDLRFPVWSRNVDSQFDCLLYLANWPQRRSTHWNSLLQARAIENQCYVAGVNRTGEDENNISYAGDSMLISPKGDLQLTAGGKSGVFYTELNYQLLQRYRERFPAFLDADRFTLND